MAKKKRSYNRVTVSVDKQTLRLQFPTQLVDTIKGQGLKFSRYRSLGKREIDPATGKSNRPWAEALASRIQADLDHPDGLFDYTLAKYLAVTIVDDKGNDASPTTMTLGNLWDDFLDYHTAGLAKSTAYQYRNNYSKKITLYRDLPISLDTSNLVRSDFLKQQNNTIKIVLQLLEKAVDWAIAQDKITLSRNPFKGLSAAIKPQKRKNKLTGMPDEYCAYSEEEAKLILESFLGDSSRYQYYSFFRFKFLTGCRTGEAIALTWNDVKFRENVILFNKTHSRKTGVTEGTKTEDCRTLPMNALLADWLRALKAQSLSSLVFSSSDGGYLSRSTLTSVWGLNPDEKSRQRPGTVIQLAKDGKLQYLSPYNTRHTFINACIERGVDTVTIGDWCGNSDNVIQQVYRSRNRNIDIDRQMPNL